MSYWKLGVGGWRRKMRFERATGNYGRLGGWVTWAVSSLK